jgi:hypothetical protein
VCALPFPTLQQLMHGCFCPAGMTRGSFLGGCEPWGTNSARAPPAAGAGHQGSVADEGCAPCLAWEWAPLGSASCLACPAGRTRARRFGEVPGAVCLPCERNEFLDPATRKCAACAPDTFSAPGAMQCQECPEGHLRAAGDAECTPCPRNTYKSGTATCSYCGEHAYSRPAKGARSIAECVCQKGAFRPAAGRPCERCPDGLFKNVTGTDDACVAPRSGYAVNKAQDGEVANSLTVAGSFFGSITTAISETFEGVLRQLYEALFGDEEAVRREIEEELARVDGRHTEENAWESAAPEAAASEDCPFASAEAVWAAVQASKDYSDLRGLRRCAEMKAAFKRLALKFHPDKFNHRFKGCDNDLSMLATREIMSAYTARSKTCA